MPILRSIRSVLRFAGAVLRRFQEDDGIRLCASLAYTSLFAIVPIVTVGLAVFAAFPAFEQFTQTIQRFFATNVLPADVAQTTLSYIDQFARNAGRLTAVGTIVVAVTAILLMSTIERAFNQIWRVRRARSLTVRLFMYWGVMTLGPILVGASLSLTSYLITHATDLTAKWPWIADMMIRIVPMLLMAAAFTLLYLVVPGKTPALKHALVGGIAAALMFESMKYGFALYLQGMPTYTMVYGTLAAFPIFLMWLYLSWVVAALGAEITALAPDFHEVTPRRSSRPEPSFQAALAVLRTLVGGQRDGKALSSRGIANAARLQVELTDLMLERLARDGWIGRVIPERWTLLVDPENVTIGTVYQRWALQSSHHGEGKRGSNDAIDRAVDRLERGVLQSLAQPLSSLLAVDEPAEPPHSARGSAPGHHDSHDPKPSTPVQLTELN